MYVLSLLQKHKDFEFIDPYHGKKQLMPAAGGEVFPISEKETTL